MSSPPDFLGLALGMLRQRQEQRQQQAYQQQRAEESQMERDRFELQMRRHEEAQQQDAEKQALAYIQGGGDLKTAEGLWGNHLRESFRPLLKEEAKAQKKRQEMAEATPDAAAQSDIATGAAAEQDPLKAAMSIIAATRSAPEGLTQTLQARQLGMRAENTRQSGEFDRRTRFGTQEELRGARGRDAINAASERGNYRFSDGRVVTATNRAEANQLVRQGGVWIGAGAGIGLSGADLNAAPTQGQLEKETISLSRQRDRLLDMREMFRPEFQTVWGRGKTAVANAADSLGISVDPSMLAFADDRDAFRRVATKQTFEAVLQLAATTFTDKIYERVSTVEFPEDAGPARTKRRIDDSINLVNRELVRVNYALRNGVIKLSDDEVQSGSLSPENREKLQTQINLGAPGAYREAVNNPAAPLSVDDILNQSRARWKAEGDRQRWMVGGKKMPPDERKAWVEEQVMFELGQPLPWEQP